MYAVIWTFMKMNKNAAAVLLSQRDVNINRNREPPCWHLFPRSPPMNGFLPLFPKSKILISNFLLTRFWPLFPYPPKRYPWEGNNTEPDMCMGLWQDAQFCARIFKACLLRAAAANFQGNRATPSFYMFVVIAVLWIFIVAKLRFITLKMGQTKRAHANHNNSLTIAFKSR